MSLSPQIQQENPLHRQLAGLHLEKYSFPVEMMICLPNGTVVGPGNREQRAGTREVLSSSVISIAGMGILSRRLQRHFGGGGGVIAKYLVQQQRQHVPKGTLSVQWTKHGPRERSLDHCSQGGRIERSRGGPGLSQPFRSPSPCRLLGGPGIRSQQLWKMRPFSDE